MKKLTIKSSILISSVYAALFYGAMTFLNQIYPHILNNLKNNTLSLNYFYLKGWTMIVLGMCAFILIGLLIYKTDFKKK